MGTNPTKAADNIYCRCRKEAAKYNDKLNSRDGAAELLGIPETYACAVIAATIGEAGICGWIRTTKDRKREHDWERADRKEDNNSEMEEMNDES